MMDMRSTKEPEREESENDLARVAKLLIPFFAFFILSLMIGEAWEGLDIQIRMAVILIVMLTATVFYRKELSDIIFD
jgi:hypothetical protein